MSKDSKKSTKSSPSEIPGTTPYDSLENLSQAEKELYGNLWRMKPLMPVGGTGARKDSRSPVANHDLTRERIIQSLMRVERLSREEAEEEVDRWL